VIRLLLIVQVPDVSDKRSTALAFRPIDRFSLRSEGAEHMVGMVFDDIIVDMAPLGPALAPPCDGEGGIAQSLSVSMQESIWAQGRLRR
jgi:hypothetical protein